MRKCYAASFEMAVLFTADEEAGDDLQIIASDALQEELAYNGPTAMENVDVVVAKYIPYPLTKDDIVYGTHKGDMTAADALKLNEEAKP